MTHVRQWTSPYSIIPSRSLRIYTYLSPLNHDFTGYLPIYTISLIRQLYRNYAQILATYLVPNDVYLWDSFNIDNPI